MSLKRIDNILVPVDYSPNSKRAIKYGVEIAKKTNAKVTLFHAYHAPLVHAEEMMFLDRMKVDEKQKMDKLLTEVREEFGDLVNVTGKVEFGSAVEWLSSLVEKEDFDLIVMGTKGDTNAIGSVIGSVASHAINDVLCSVLVIPEDVRSFNITEVLYATDFHKTNNHSYLNTLLRLMEVYDPNIEIVNFKESLESHEFPSKEELMTDHAFEDFKHSFHFIETTDVEKGIFDFVEENNCDLIVVLTKHYNLWQRIFHRSVTKKVALHTKVPLLVLHEND